MIEQGGTLVRDRVDAASLGPTTSLDHSPIITTRTLDGSFTDRILSRGISRDNPYTEFPDNARTASQQGRRDARTRPVSVSARSERTRKTLPFRVPQKAALLAAGAALTPIFLGAAGCALNAGTVTSIIVEGTKTPNVFVQAFNAAANVCPEIITEKDLAADAFKETTDDELDTNHHEVSDSDPPALGPMQWKQTTWNNFILKNPKLGYGPNDLWDVDKSVYGSAVYDCENAEANGDSEADALSIYYTGSINSVGLEYAREVNDIANTEQIISSSGKGNSNGGNATAGVNGRLPDVNGLSTSLVFSQSVNFWQSDNKIVEFQRTGPNTWAAEGDGFSVINGKTGRDPAGQGITLNVNENAGTATLTVTG